MAETYREQTRMFWLKYEDEAYGRSLENLNGHA